MLIPRSLAGEISVIKQQKSASFKREASNQEAETDLSNKRGWSALPENQRKKEGDTEMGSNE